MKHNGPHVHFEAILEAPIWMIVAAIVAVTVAVIASSIGLF